MALIHTTGEVGSISSLNIDCCSSVNAKGTAVPPWCWICELLVKLSPCNVLWKGVFSTPLIKSVLEFYDLSSCN